MQVSLERQPVENLEADALVVPVFEGEKPTRFPEALAELAELSHRLLTTTETVERLASGITNHVLFAGTVTLLTGPESTFYWTFQFGAPCGVAEVHNWSSTDDLVVEPGPANVRPVQGPGVHYIKPGTFRMCNLDQRVFTIWGSSAQLVGVQALTIGGIVGAGRAT